MKRSIPAVAARRAQPADQMAAETATLEAVDHLGGDLGARPIGVVLGLAPR